MWECPHQHFAQHTEICPRASGAARLRALLHVPGVVVRGGSHGRRRIGELCCLRLCPGVAHRPTGLRVCHSQCYHIGGFPQGDGSGLRHRWRHPGNNRNVRPGVLCPPQLHTHHSPSGPVLRRQLALPALPSSLTVISVKAVSGMIAESIKGQLQLIYPIFYVMLVVMVASCAFQIKFLNQAMKMFDATEVVPINFVFFTASAIVAGIVFYQEFEGLALLNIFMFLFGCLLSFLGVFLIARNRPKIKEQDRNFIAMDVIPGRRHTDKVQPEATATTYGSLAAKLMCHRAGQTDDS
ncbi:NIPA-like protein 2 isoform X4 [Scophthalmus maximus]|uniref:NIPA-like protein 2 isoform X4 n=1 Tax=Scophthalmus maximus TaxID=52904 RepID=UPI001FA8FDFA|nr:NIPA-like protein 2 isoform X4 [Scophthalmus maximus]